MQISTKSNSTSNNCHRLLISLHDQKRGSEKGMDFEIDGYEMVCKNRENKNGGGVTLFVKRILIIR